MTLPGCSHLNSLSQPPAFVSQGFIFGLSRKEPNLVHYRLGGTAGVGNDTALIFQKPRF